ncbi:MAG: hypothetical protein ABSB40_12035 [Nitrososphaeria archaeon]
MADTDNTQQTPPVSDQPGKATVAPTTITGNPPTQGSLAYIGEGAPAPSTNPLSTQGYVDQQVGSAEERKMITSQLAEAQAKGTDTQANLLAQATQEQDRMLNGDPVKRQQSMNLYQAAKTHLAANPDSQEAKDALYQAKLGTELNSGAKDQWARAKLDADNRDAELRKKIATVQAQQIDPDHWWNQKSTGSKIAAGIGIILGGAGAGLQRRGGENPAMQVINRAVDQDIDAQKTNIRNNMENSWKQIAATHELDDSAFNRELHNQVWQSNYKNAALETVKLQLQQAAAKTQSDVTRQNALIGIQDLTDQQAKIRNGLYNMQQASMAANLQRIRKNGEDVSKAAQDYAKEKGVDLETAEKAVWGTDTRAKELIYAGYAPTWITQAEGQKHLAQVAIAAKIKSGIAPEVAMQQVLADPKFDALRRWSTPVGTVVPNPEVDKDVRERTVTINGQDYLARDAKQAEAAATAANSALEVKKINARILALANKGGILGPSERAEMDSLLDMGALHYPRMQTGSMRVNDTEIQMGKDTYQGKGDWYRGDILSRKAGHLTAINQEADQRLHDALDGLQPLNRQGPGVSQPQQSQVAPGQAVGLSGKVYGVK